MVGTVLILGAAGRFGHSAALAFHEAGWSVRRWLRPGREASGPGEAIFGDLHDAVALPAAAQGVDVIVNALNPPYPTWGKEVPRITQAVINAARASGATVMMPGNVYNYGSSLPAVLSEETPFVGDHLKASIRIEMEAAYQAAEIQTIILRAGDFIDTRAGDNWFEGQIAKAVEKGRVTYPGPTDLPHAWAYLPDMARAMAMLADRRQSLPRFISLGFPGYALTGDALISHIEGATGRVMKRSGFPWPMLHLLSPFMPLLREVVAMRYLWRRSHQIDGEALAQILPDFQPTPPAEAIHASLIGTGQIAA